MSYGVFFSAPTTGRKSGISHFRHVYIYIYMLTPPPPQVPRFGLGSDVL